MSAISSPNNPPEVVLTALRVMNNITASTQLAAPGADDTSALADALFSPRSLEALCAILYQESTVVLVQEQKRLVANLISQLCKGPQHQNALANSGVVDALATMLASFVAARGEVVACAEVVGEVDNLDKLIPAPAAPGADLALVLEALSTIVANSRFRSCLLRCSPSIMAIFPCLEFKPPASEQRQAWAALELSGYGRVRHREPGAMDYMLSAVPIPQSRPKSKTFEEYPPLGYSPSRDNLAGASASGTRSSTFEFGRLDLSRVDLCGEDEIINDPESPLIPWLIHLVRSPDGLERVMAASLLTSLFKAGLASPDREQYLVVLVIPLLCQLMMDYDNEIPASVLQSPYVQPDIARQWLIQERAPDVLARLVGESEALQQGAYDCGAIRMAVKLLKDSYEPQPTQGPPRPWSPTPERPASSEEGLPTCRVGPPGQVPASVHRIKMRASALKLVAAMATLSHEYRQALVAADVVPYIAESLSRYPGKPKSPKEKSATDRMTDGGDTGEMSPYGYNTNAVIIAACHATRALARSPSVVRTALQDHGVGLPINTLLRHPDTEVQVAASGALINLVTNCSPLVQVGTPFSGGWFTRTDRKQQLFLEADIVKTLCENAHSHHPGLQVNALWGLKHLVSNLDNNLRKQCLEELEPGWLVQLISDDSSDEEASRARERSQRRATDADNDEDMDSEFVHDTSDTPQPWTWPALLHHRPPLPPSSQRILQASAKLNAIHDAEFNQGRKTRADTLAIQEQGLGFIRNLIMLPNPSNQTDMVDYLFAELGQDRLFGILADKLRMRVVGAMGRRAAAGSTTPGNAAVALYPQPRIIENLTYILVHMAAGAPRHRQLVVAQTELLRLLGTHFSSSHAGVRKALCQLFMNLSYLESDADRQPWSLRSSELERLGVLASLEKLEKGDADLGVRERAKAAVAQMKCPTA